MNNIDAISDEELKKLEPEDGCFTISKKLAKKINVAQELISEKGKKPVNTLPIDKIKRR